MQEPNHVPGADASGITSNDVGSSHEALLAAIDATIRPFDEGDVVSGTVVRIDKDEVLVDIGYKSEGVIPAKELTIRHDVDPGKEVRLGDQIDALVLQKEDKEGRLILSKKRAHYEKAWGRVEKIKSSQETVKGPVIEVVKGGLIVDVGLRGFLPASLVDVRRVRDLQGWVGKEIECKVIELDRNRNNVVLSRRAFLEESHSEQRKDFLTSLAKGESRKGTVSSVVNFGAFVDLGGGVDGLVHVSELSWKHVEHPSEVVAVSQEVDVVVLDVDLERERVSLSLKSTQDDPWKVFAGTHHAGERLPGKVTKLVPYGAFIEIAEGIEGLIHISELTEGHVDTPDQVLALGQEAQVRIIEVDLERRRVSLSLREERSETSSDSPQGDVIEAAEESPPDSAEAKSKLEPTEESLVDSKDLVAPSEGDGGSEEVDRNTAAAADDGLNEEVASALISSDQEKTEDEEDLLEGSLEGELLEKEEATRKDDSLESIVEDLKREHSS